MDHNKWQQIETFIFDVDGVFTDGSLLITEAGEFLRTMHVRDGMALKTAVKKGYKVIIITKGNSKGVKDRLLALGAHMVYDEIDDKSVPFQELITEHGLDPHKALYVGDDLADIVLFDKVLLSCAPKDAAPEVLQRAEYISPVKGGKGVIRDIVENVLRTRGDWYTFPE